MTDQTIRVNGLEYNLVIYQTFYGWRAEAAYLSRVVEVADVPQETEALGAIRKRLEARQSCRERG